MAADNQDKKPYACTVYFNYYEGTAGKRSADQEVAYAFLKVLEDKFVSCGINLDNVLHYGRLPLGATVFELLKNIEDSVRLVFILTKDFIENNWHVITEQIAFKHMVETKKQMLVLCIDMEKKDLPSDLGLGTTTLAYFQKDENTWQDDDNWIKIKTCFPTGLRPEDTITIVENSIGHSYESLFRPNLEEKGSDVKKIEITDPFLWNNNQINNLKCLCELLIKLKMLNKCPIETITVYTKETNKKTVRDEQKQNLVTVCSNVNEYVREKDPNFEMKFEFDSRLHDREIRCDSGLVFHLGRGLDIYNDSPKGFAIGSGDLELRPCRGTTIIALRKT